MVRIKSPQPVSNDPLLVRFTSSGIRASTLDTGSILSYFFFLCNLSRFVFCPCSVICVFVCVLFRSCLGLVAFWFFVLVMLFVFLFFFLLYFFIFFTYWCLSQLLILFFYFFLHKFTKGLHQFRCWFNYQLLFVILHHFLLLLLFIHVCLPSSGHHSLAFFFWILLSVSSKSTRRFICKLFGQLPYLDLQIFYG